MILKELNIILEELEVGYKWLDSNPLASDTESMLAPTTGVNMGQQSSWNSQSEMRAKPGQPGHGVHGSHGVHSSHGGRCGLSSGAGPVRVVVKILHRFRVAPNTFTHSSQPSSGCSIFHTSR